MDRNFNRYGHLIHSFLQTGRNKFIADSGGVFAGLATFFSLLFALGYLG
jgi:hypothetical protein